MPAIVFRAYEALLQVPSGIVGASRAMKNGKPGYITALGRSDTPGGWSR